MTRTKKILNSTQEYKQELVVSLPQFQTNIDPQNCPVS